MQTISLPAAWQSPSKVVIEVPALGLKATIHFKAVSKAASERARRSNGRFATALHDAKVDVVGPFSQAPE